MIYTICIAVAATLIGFYLFPELLPSIWQRFEDWILWLEKGLENLCNWRLRQWGFLKGTLDQANTKFTASKDWVLGSLLFLVAVLVSCANFVLARFGVEVVLPTSAELSWVLWVFAVAMQAVSLLLGYFAYDSKADKAKNSKIPLGIFAVTEAVLAAVRTYQMLEDYPIAMLCMAVAFVTVVTVFCVWIPAVTISRALDSFVIPFVEVVLNWAKIVIVHLLFLVGIILALVVSIVAKVIGPIMALMSEISRHFRGSVNHGTTIVFSWLLNLPRKTRDSFRQNWKKGQENRKHRSVEKRFTKERYQEEKMVTRLAKVKRRSDFATKKAAIIEEQRRKLEEIRQEKVVEKTGGNGGKTTPINLDEIKIKKRGEDSYEKNPLASVDSAHSSNDNF